MVPDKIQMGLHGRMRQASGFGTFFGAIDPVQLLSVNTTQGGCPLTRSRWDCFRECDGHQGSGTHVVKALMYSNKSVKHDEHGRILYAFFSLK